MIIHCKFRDTRASWCAEAMHAIAAGNPGWDEFLRRVKPFAGLPTLRLLSWLLGIGSIALLGSGAIVVGAL